MIAWVALLFPWPGPQIPSNPNVASNFAMVVERCIQGPFMTSRASPQARWQQSGGTKRAMAPLTGAATSLGATLTALRLPDRFAPAPNVG
jgi:hypothetical protein